MLGYSTIRLAVTGALVPDRALRVRGKVDGIRARGMLGREVENGDIENIYRLQMINSEERTRRYRISVSGIDSLRVAGNSEVEVDPAGTRMFPVAVRAAAGQGSKGSNKVMFTIEAVDDPAIATREKSTFFVPR